MMQSAPYYWLTCDHDECGNISTNGDDVTAWSDEASAVEMAENGDWLILDGKHYCDGHRHAYEKEEE